MSYVEYGYSAHENEDVKMEAALAKAGGFNQADIDENETGRISTKQMLALTYKGVVPLMGLIIPLVGLLVLVGSVALFGPWVLMKLSFLLKFSKYLMFGLSALVLGALAILAKGVVASRRLVFLLVDLATGRSQQAVGKVSVSRSDEVEDGINQISGKRTEMFFFVQGQRTFQVAQSAHDELQAMGGVGYFKINFTPRSHYLLSMQIATGAQVAEAKNRAA